jgi:hypothetical protein
MQTTNTIKVITLAGFLLLVSGFIAFRAGVFDRYFKTEKPKVITTNIDTAALNMAIQKIFPEPEPYDKNRPKVVGLDYRPKMGGLGFIPKGIYYSLPESDDRSIMYQYGYEYEVPNYAQRRWRTIDYNQIRLHNLLLKKLNHN